MAPREEQSRPPRKQLDTLAFAAFPETQVGLIDRARHDQSSMRRQALGEWYELYHDAIRTRLLLRHRLAVEDAKDVAAAFVAKAVEDGRVLASYDRDGGSQFRSYLIASIDNFVRDWHDARQRLKRGGAAGVGSLPEDAVAMNHADGRGDAVAADEAFHRACVRSCIDAVLDQMRRQYEESGEPFRWIVFDRLVLGPELRNEAKPPYAKVAAEVGITSPSKIAGICTNAKRLFDRMLLEAEGLTGASDDERLRARKSLLAYVAEPAVRAGALA